jgi:hypothetical protein
MNTMLDGGWISEIHPDASAQFCSEDQAEHHLSKWFYLRVIEPVALAFHEDHCTHA